MKFGLILNFCNILMSCRESFIFKQIFQNVTGTKEDTNLLKTPLEIIINLWGFCSEKLFVLTNSKSIFAAK